MTETTVKDSLQLIEVGDVVVVQDQFGWGKRLQVAKVTKTTPTTITLESGALYHRINGKLKGRHSMIWDRLFAPHELIDWGNDKVTATKALELYLAADKENDQKLDLTNYILNQVTYNKLMKQPLEKLERIAKELGYQEVNDERI